MNDPTDQQLLRAYAAHRSEAAFTELVRRHVDLVYSAALRMVCDAHLAQDVTQATFVALAQNTNQLTDRAVLSGWLHRTAQNLASKTVRAEVRRRAREQEAAAMNELLSAAPDASWDEIAPHLDAALGELSEPDRDALFLRYFEKKSAQEMAIVLDVSAEAVQKRVSRAVERLRESFVKRGITAGASGLAVVISANAVQAAPVGLAFTISTAIALTGTTIATTTTVTATKAIAMTALQKTIVTATITVLIGAGIYEARQAAQSRDQVQMLQQQQMTLAEQIQQLQNERDDMTNRLAGLLEENSRLKNNPDLAELLKLRGEIGRIRQNYNNLLKENQALQANVSSEESTNEISADDRAILLKQHATDAAGLILDALRKYASENDGRRPETLEQLLLSGNLKTTNLVGKLTLNDFKLAPAGFTGFQGKEILLYLRAPIRNPGNQSIMVQGGIAPDGTPFTEIHGVAE